MERVERALLSVADKTGLVDFARRLAALGVELISTGGTASLLRQSGLSVRDVAELTGWPEMLGGRVKTLHPAIHGGILFRRDHPDDRQQVARHRLTPIDLVVVNLYPFEQAARRPGVDAGELIENIDIGGPALLRAAAKNFRFVGVVSDPADYDAVASELEQQRTLSLETRLRLARRAFAHTARYDGLIATTLERLDAAGDTVHPEPLLPERLFLALERRQALRYGENPHQAAALYTEAEQSVEGLAGAEQLQGKELSFNNLVDLQAGWELVQEFAAPAVAIIKHTNPCGAAEAETLEQAYRRALECDPVSAFGGVVACNRPVDEATAAAMTELFLECVVAPGCTEAAREVLARRKNLRVLSVTRPAWPLREFRAISGGWLVQQPDTAPVTEQDWKVVTQRAPDPEQWEALRFAWKVVRHVKSNAIVFARAGQTVGVGAGQMSRVDAVRLAAWKARLPLEGTVVASDAFFPFPDGVEEAARAGARAIIQPGGSVRDAEVIAAADRLGLAMVFTGRRHFRH